MIFGKKKNKGKNKTIRPIVVVNGPIRPMTYHIQFISQQFCWDFQIRIESISHFIEETKLIVYEFSAQFRNKNAQNE